MKRSGRYHYDSEGSREVCTESLRVKIGQIKCHFTKLHLSNPDLVIEAWLNVFCKTNPARKMCPPLCCSGGLDCAKMMLGAAL